MPTNSTAVADALIQLERKLQLDHPRLVLYEIGGSSIFPVYSVSGGLAAEYLCYWILKGSGPLDGSDLGRRGVAKLDAGKKPWLRLAIELDPCADLRKVMADVEARIAAFLLWASQDNLDPVEGDDILKWAEDHRAKGVTDAT